MQECIPFCPGQSTDACTEDELTEYIEDFPDMLGIVKEQFDREMDAAMAEDYSAAEVGRVEKNLRQYYNDRGEDIFVYAASQEDVDAVRKLVESAENRFEPHATIQNIINEEAAGYFSGQVGLESTVEKIQNRVSLLLQECSCRMKMRRKFADCRKVWLSK